MATFQDKMIDLVMKVSDFITGSENPTEVVPTSNTLVGVTRTGLDKSGGGNANVIEPYSSREIHVLD